MLLQDIASLSFKTLLNFHGNILAMAIIITLSHCCRLDNFMLSFFFFFHGWIPIFLHYIFNFFFSSEHFGLIVC